jgi:uncharacterized Tic20 family protein
MLPHDCSTEKGTTTMTDPAQPAQSQPAAPLTEAEDKQWASFAHLGGIIWILPSLIIWLIFKDRGVRTNVEAKEALNFQITVGIAQIAVFIINTILTTVTLGFWALIGWILPLGIWVASLIFSIMGFSKLNAGGSYRYPINIRFIK